MIARSSRARILGLGVALLLLGAAIAWASGAGTDGTPKPAAPSSTLPSAEVEEPAASAQRSPDGAFVASAGRRPAELWAVGDGAAAERAGAEVSGLIEANDPDRVLYLGDVYESGTADDFAENYAPTYGRLAPITAPTIGNHEAPNARLGYRPYWREVHGRTPPRFYSFRIAGWELLSLNSEIDHSSDSAQVRWIKRATREGGDCRIAFLHRPRYSAGTTHGDDRSLQPLWAALRGSARLVLAAHDHNMQRFAPRQGMVELIAGSGGRGLYDVKGSHRGLRFANDRELGALRLRLRPGRASYAFVSASGEVLDSGSRRCRSD